MHSFAWWSFLQYVGDKFVSKHVDDKKEKKLKNVEDKMLGWGMFLEYDSLFNLWFSLISPFSFIFFELKCNIDLPSRNIFTRNF